MEFKHISVLYKETLDGLNIKDGGLYVDGTLGGGGHSCGILSGAKNVRLIGIDRDSEAIEAAGKRLSAFKDRITLVNRNFSDIKQIASELGIAGIDGAVLDLGVSSYQLDNAERGFSYMHDSHLDMRMNRNDKKSAYEVINSYSQNELEHIFYAYGEEKWSARVAKFIVEKRSQKPIETTFELVDIIKASMPMKAKRDGHPARKTFQALRIEVNGELEKLERALDDMFEALNPSGRIAIITFHSLEDRIVKKKFNKFCEGCICPPEFPVCVCGRKPRGKLPFKSKSPTENEVGENFRAHSARLRAIEKI